MTLSIAPIATPKMPPDLSMHMTFLFFH